MPHAWQRYGNVFCFNLYIDIDFDCAYCPEHDLFVGMLPKKNVSEVEYGYSKLWEY
jgi:hypothetical protein